MIRELPIFLVNQIAAGEVIERPANVVKELVENSLDAGATNLFIEVIDGGRTQISVSDDGIGMTKEDLEKSIKRHATSKLPTDDLTNIRYMGFRGEALPSIASVSDMFIDSYNLSERYGWQLNCNNYEIKPSSWNNGTRVLVKNLFAKTPARLKFLHSDRSEMLNIVDIVKRLALSRPDVGFNLNNKWSFPKGQSFYDRVISVLGNDADGKMIEIENTKNSSGAFSMYGYISEPTFRRATSIDQYLFVNNRSVKDKVIVGALRASYMDVMHAREFPLCVLYFNMDPSYIDVNVSPSKTEVHFLEPSRLRGFMIRTIRNKLSQTMVNTDDLKQDFISYESSQDNKYFISNLESLYPSMKENIKPFIYDKIYSGSDEKNELNNIFSSKPLGRVIGQFSKKYIIAESGDNLVIIDQHAAHERIVYEKLRNNSVKRQVLLTPIIVNLSTEKVMSVLEIKEEMKNSGLLIDSFGDNSIAIFEKPADWDLDWNKLFNDISDEVLSNGHSSQLQEKLHLKLANYACHHSVRAGQKLDYAQMDALLRDIETTERASQCNHGRPVYKFIKMSELDSWFERI